MSRFLFPRPFPWRSTKEIFTAEVAEDAEKNWKESNRNFSALSAPSSEAGGEYEWAKQVDISDPGFRLPTCEAIPRYFFATD